MKFIRFMIENKEKIGVLNSQGDKIIELSEISDNPTDGMIELISNFTDEKFQKIKEMMNTQDGTYELENVKICSPIRKPRHDIICVGVNYAKHLEETQNHFNADLKHLEDIVFFSKRTVDIIGNEDTIEGHFDLDEKLDYEVELAVIIGKKGKNIPESEVEEYIFGYSIFNDLSSRGLQKKHTQWFRGKSLDTYCSMGPILVYKDELALPFSLNISSEVNGEIRQNSNTNFFLNNIPKIISEISCGMTLEPGDIISTGTPDGVGMGFNPPKYLKENDVIICKIEKIGELKNKVKKL